MELNFTRLTLEKFGSFNDRQTFKLDEPGVAFIVGVNQSEPRLASNGAGKSTLLNALPWCLYGKTTNGLLSTDVRPWSGKGKTEVSVIYWIGDKKHTLLRTAGPNSLTLNGKVVSQDDVDKSMGMSYEVFRQTVFLGQGRPLFHDLANREKLAFLADVLNLDKWDEYSAKASAAYRKLETDKVKCEVAIEQATESYKVLDDQAGQAEAEAIAWEDERARKVKDIATRAKACEEAAFEATEFHGRTKDKLDKASKGYRELRNDMMKAERAHATHSAELQAILAKLNS